SAKLMIASGQQFADLSREANGRSPMTWQTEFTDQVMWCRELMRTRLAQKNAVNAPCQDIDQSPPSSAGVRRVTASHTGNRSSTRLMSGSASRSGVNRSSL